MGLDVVSAVGQAHLEFENLRFTLLQHMCQDLEQGAVGFRTDGLTQVGTDERFRIQIVQAAPPAAATEELSVA